MDHTTHKSELGHLTDGEGHDRTEDVIDEESETLISAEKVIGTPVYNRAGERLGSIDQLMLNKRSGRVAFAVMSFGGVLGIGERYQPLPWARLTYDEARSGYNVDLSPEQLASAPHFGRDEAEREADGPVVHNYYGNTDWERAQS